MTKNLFVFSLGCVAFACGPDSTYALTSSLDDAAMSELLPAPLSLRYQPSAAELQDVQAHLGKQFPGATATVSNARGTPAFLHNFTLPLKCDAGRQVSEAVLEALAERPEAFRLDATEWAGDGALTCSQVKGGAVYVPVTRHKAGGNAAGDQSLTVRVSRLTRSLVVADVFAGSYLPAGLPVEDAMSAAPLVSEKQLHATVEKTDLPYATFAYCAPTGAGVWNVARGDDLSLSAATWLRDEDATGTTLWPQRTAEVRIAPGNVKPVLLQSDAYCPPAVGWNVRLDALKGQVREVAAGLGCVVCLAP